MLLTSLLPVLLNEPSYPAFTTPREFRAAWVATVANIDWPTKPGLSVDALKAEMIAILDTAEATGLNAIIFQVRPSADAMYASPYEPWSWFLTGEQGVGPGEGFDPLTFAIEEAHKRGLELHVWLNPYRALHFRQAGPTHPTHIRNTNPELVKKYGQFEWMDPGEPKVQERSFQVFMDLVERYDIDGIHIDDYFYPYPVKDAQGKDVPFPDEPSFRAARAKNPRLKRDDWRRKNVDDFILRVHKGIKERKRWVKFGISPFGIYRPGVPKGIRAGVDQYAQLYADARKWLQKGWCDYFTPQLYWPIKQEAQSFPKLLNWWRGANIKGRHLWPGLYTSRTNPSDGNWSPDEVVNQIGLIRKTGGAAGAVHFSFKAIQNNWNNIGTRLADGPYAARAIPPSYPWLRQGAPKEPESVASSAASGVVVVKADSSDQSARFVTVSTLRNGKWQLDKVGRPGEALGVSGLAPGMVLRATVVDKVGTESRPRFAKAED